MTPAWPTAKNMPALDASAGRISYFEFWPPWKIYAGLPGFILWLSLRYGGLRHPLTSNPGFAFSGLVGESKLDILALLKGQVSPDMLLGYAQMTVGSDPVEARVAQAEHLMAAEGLHYPLVAKPDMSCRGAGVQKLADKAALTAYLDGFPAPADLVFQELADLPGEAGVFYARIPGERHGRIFSLTLKYFPHVFGDGHSTLKALIRAEPRAGMLKHLYLPRFADRLDWVPQKDEPVRLTFAGSHSKGALFRNGNDYITQAMVHAFDEIADAMDGFWIGRYDVRFADFNDLRAGRNFKIIEVNGAGAEATHIWDSRTSLWQAQSALYEQWRWLYRIGRINRKHGAKPAGLSELWRAWRQEARLTQDYPPTH